ncbi:MAG: TatD family hydrolase [Candidatus Aenigmarchaeota archaeon]|nr:TatD family hydrolase [Candidatus Aenigmarchaeota archaeon]
MKTIDCHCHIQDKKYKTNFDEFMAEVKEKCLFVIASGANKKWNRDAISLTKKYPKLIYATIGLHPIDAQKTSEKEFEEELKFIEQNKDNIVGVGEIGLDYHWEKDAKKKQIQKQRFIEFLNLAKKINKPVVIHSWDAEEDCIDILKENNMKTVVMHCFSGKRPAMEKALSYGYYISFSTNLLFSKLLKKLARDCPVEKMLVETDAPYLDPNHTGKNMPWNTMLSIKKIAGLKNIEPDELLKKITQNAKNVYGIV